MPTGRRPPVAGESLTRLGQGLLVYPANTGLRDRLAGNPDAAEQYYRQLHVLLFRLLFVGLAEQRGLLFGPAVPEATRARYRRDYSLQHLAERQRGASGATLYERLTALFAGLAHGCPGRGLEPLGSWLWSEEALPDLAGCHLADADLLGALAALPAPDNPGILYQRLLEFHPVLDVERRDFTLVEAGGHRRKTSGSYYTPDNLVACLLASALDPAIERALARPDPEGALRSLRIFDPACGSGHFLSAACRRLAAARCRSGAASSPAAAYRDVARDCLFGMDSDPLAVELCKMALWLECAEPGRTPGFLADRIRRGNSLVDDPPGGPGGFDVVLANPPWERFKLQEKEWFAARCPAVAAATDAHTRKKLILSLKEQNPALFAAYRAAVRRAEAEGRLIRTSGGYPLSGRGDLNAYGPFVERSRQLLREEGRAGLIVPSGLATDDTMKELFQDLLRSGLVSWYDFHNRGRLFPGVQGNVKFGLLTLSTTPRASFTAAAQLDDPARLVEPGRTYRLSAGQVARLNPNTLHCPPFACARDAELVGRLHQRFPVLVREQPPANPWGLHLRTMFHMTHDAPLFRTREVLEREGRVLAGNVFQGGHEQYLPLYEAKLVRAFDHKAATFAGVAEAVRFRTHARARPFSEEEKADSGAVVLPRYWVPEEAVRARCGDTGWFLGFRNAISAVADARSLVAAIVPRAGLANSMPYVGGMDARRTCLLLGLLNSFVLDYVLRQKASGGNLNFHVFKQLPVPPPEAFAAHWPGAPGQTLADGFVARVLELTYTAPELQGFARECGCEGPPFVRDEERRQWLRGELDAACFQLYGLNRAEIEYVLDTFSIAERQETRRHGRFLSRELILGC